MAIASSTTTTPRSARLLRGVVAVIVLVVVFLASLFVNVADISPIDVLRGTMSDRHALYFFQQRIPRALSAALAGSSLAIAGLLMQVLARNRFVSPSTVGTVESAGLGLVIVAIIAPGMPLFGKMLIAMVFAMGGTAIFLTFLAKIKLRDSPLVPLVGIMLGSVISAVATFLAVKYGLLQMLSTWLFADFSAVLSGRYELLWVVAGLAVLTYLLANFFTIAGLGEDTATNLGLSHRTILWSGMAIVAAVAAAVVVTVGSIPFLGIVVPNIVTMFRGDNMRENIPWVAFGGAITVLVCDTIGRTLPDFFTWLATGTAAGVGEIPVGTVMGAVGGIIFLYLLLKGDPRRGDAK
ncbi:iron complex transport system permease protein [Corynebacterium spheniscorum]|uniref:Iron complex transport system permease protein n=1 Tax=Corynebacterium spheniscorum TaxID=185761 RepID=A0A1I2QQB5_9CORY|nr:iron complex transport system permease protein [Corynebacterium spheniscorum]